ncbi:hypothetical protein [Robiginitomaculum antarcticum]|uniref:hypothetical protein n=1 Tax=Robiginitomaculum antarcticum TaxID=437507 RepID=UPI0003747565|nr:hypothetical protein [Robiginitomaculum antarcticum]
MFKYLIFTGLSVAPFMSGPAFGQSAANPDREIEIYMSAAIACSKAVQQGGYAAGTETDCFEVKRLLDDIINSGEPMTPHVKNYAVLADILVYQTISTVYAKIEGIGSTHGCQIVRDSRAVSAQYVNGETPEADLTMSKIVGGIDELGKSC